METASSQARVRSKRRQRNDSAACARLVGDARRRANGYLGPMHRVVIVASMVSLVTWASIVAAEPVAHPAKGQSFDKQNRDQYECHGIAQKETGVDPVAVAEQATAASKSDSGQKPGMGSGLGGAGIGAMRGAADGDAGAGALHGAGMGRLIAVIRSRRQMEQQKQAGQAENADLRGQLDKYDRAYAACMTGRGYEVK